MTDASARRPPPVSARAARIVDAPPFAEYIRAHFDQADDPFHPHHNPDGYISLCVAENKLMTDLMLPRLSAVDAYPDRALGYDTMIGSEPFRENLARFMERTWVGRTVDPGNLAVLAGAGSVLEAAFYALCDPGDGVLIPTPSYAGFWADLETRDEITVLPVHCSSSDGFRLTTELLDEALDRAMVPAKALLFTSPNNPLGWVYSPEEIDEVVTWAEDRGLHVVLDEIYALSVYGARPFTSVAAVRRSLGDHIHVVWAFSKDFGASGLRCGALWSENHDVLATVDGLAYWSAVSGQTQHVLSEMVADDAWVDGYLEELRERLGASHRATVEALDAIGVSVIPAEAGIFVVCDMRPFLGEVTWAAEDALWRRLLSEANVNLTPGSACHNGEPGFMRLCFAAQPTATVIEGIRRAGRVLAS